MLTPFTPTPHEWDSFVDAHPHGHALQLSAWGTLKSAFGWQAHRVALRDSLGAIQAGAQVLYRPLPMRLGTMAYIPFGPLTQDSAHLPALMQAVRAASRPYRAAFVKLEPGFVPLADFAALGVQVSPQTVQPPNTILIDISGSDETLFARMNEGTRRKIRTGAKKGVTYYQAPRDALPKFTAMMQTTGARNRFGVHDPAYYEQAYDLFVPHHAALFMAEHEGDTLAGVFVFTVGTMAYYLYGASSNEKRNLMATYGVQWAAIQWAKARGCTVYDLWGIPDAPPETLEAEFEQRSDGLWGVYGFKRGWGGTVTRTVGALDWPINPLLYRAYRLALKRSGA